MHFFNVRLLSLFFLGKSTADLENGPREGVLCFLVTKQALSVTAITWLTTQCWCVPQMSRSVKIDCVCYFEKHISGFVRPQSRVNLTLLLKFGIGRVSRLEDVIDHCMNTNQSCMSNTENKARKKNCTKSLRESNQWPLCDIGAVLYQGAN